MTRYEVWEDAYSTMLITYQNVSRGWATTGMTLVVAFRAETWEEAKYWYDTHFRDVRK